MVIASACSEESEAGIAAWGIAAREETIAENTSAIPLQKRNGAQKSDPLITNSVWHRSDPTQSGANMNPATMFERGATREIWAKMAAESGSVAMLADNVKTMLSFMASMNPDTGFL